MEGPERGKIESKIARNPVKRSEVESLIDKSNKLLDKLWAKTMGASDGSDRICQLCTHFGCEETWGHSMCQGLPGYPNSLGDSRTNLL
jgi:Rieske Fe-S protein